MDATRMYVGAATASGSGSGGTAAMLDPVRPYDEFAGRRVDAAMAGFVGKLLPPILPLGNVLALIAHGPGDFADGLRESYKGDQTGPAPLPNPPSRPANLGGIMSLAQGGPRNARFLMPPGSYPSTPTVADLKAATPGGAATSPVVARSDSTKLAGPPSSGVIDAGSAPVPGLTPRGGFGAGSPDRPRPLPDTPQDEEVPTAEPRAVPAPAAAQEGEAPAAAEVPLPLGADLISEFDPLRGDAALDALLDELLEHFDGLGVPLREQVRDLAYVYPVVAAVVALEAARRWRKHRSGRGPIRLWKARSRTLQIFS